MSAASFGHRADVAAVVASLVVVTALAWTATVRLASGMAMPAAAMGLADPAMAMDGNAGVVVLGMWMAMMVGMMVPSATPMLLTYTAWTRQGPATGNRAVAVVSFVAGYLVVWLGFSVVAAVLQAGLERAGLLSTMGATGPVVGGVVLVLAGAFQFTPAKEACLGRCRTPVGFLAAEWRDGARGGLVMGIRHGLYCLGCCWALMAVLFVVGTMHLAWMGVIAAFVLVEKLAPRAWRVRIASGVALVGWGLVTVGTSGS